MYNTLSIEERITRARIHLLRDHPFWGLLATRLQLKEVKEEWCKTAATDGRSLFYNREWMEALKEREMWFLLAHEISHVVYDHMSRRGSRDPKLWNAAADFAINLELKEAKIGDMPSCGGLIDDKYAGKCAEEIYEILKEDPNFDYSGFDVHMELGEGMTEAEKDQLREEITNNIVQAAQASDAGKLPASVREMIKGVTSPKMSWREILNVQIQSALKTDYTWTRRSKKSHGMGVYLPDRSRETRLEAAVALDTSGSMTDSILRDLLGEIYSIVTQYNDFAIHLWCFDTRNHNYETFTPENVEELRDYKIGGGGGTDFSVCWDFMKEKDIVPDRFIMLTDGYNCSPQWGDENYCESIFVIHGDPGQKIVAPFGTTVYYDESGS